MAVSIASQLREDGRARPLGFALWSGMSSSIYHLVDAALWAACEGRALYEPTSLATEGFIHFSAREQVVGSAERFFGDHERLTLLRVDPSRLQSELRYDEADGQRFPHLYGPLNLDAVVECVQLTRDESGRFGWPAGF